jgi:hypothetical protein
MLQGLPLVQLTTHIGTGNVLHHALQEAEASEIQGQITCFSSKKFAPIGMSRRKDAWGHDSVCASFPG